MTALGRRLLIPGLIVIAGLAAYSASLGYGFVFDEKLLIVENPAAHDPTQFRAIFGQGFWPGPGAGVYYRPVVTLSYAVGYALAGDAPWLHHLFNLIFHLAASLLGYDLLIRLSGKKNLAALVALIFAIHPVHAESVAWVPGRTDVLATLFMIAAWLGLLRARERRGAGKAAWLVVALASYLAAFGSKEIAVVLVALIFVYDFLTAGRSVKKYLAEYVALIVMTALLLVWRAHVLGAAGGEAVPAALAGLSAGKTISSMLMIFGEAFRVIMFPSPWRIDYAYAESMLAAPPGAVVLAAALIAAMLAAIVLAWKKMPLLAFALAGFLISILPVSHLIPFPTLFAERFFYLPSLFIILAGVWLMQPLLFSPLTRPHRNRVTSVAWTAIGLLFIFLTTLTISRARIFKDDLRFWRGAVRQMPDLPVARNWLGIAYRDRERFTDAERQYRQALTLDPNFHAAEMNLAEILMIRGETVPALKILQDLANQTPDDPAVRVNLGVAYWRLERWEEAKREADAALRLDPNNLLAHLLRAEFEWRFRQDRPAALAEIETARQLRPDHPWLKKLETELGAPGP